MYCFKLSVGTLQTFGRKFANYRSEVICSVLSSFCSCSDCFAMLLAFNRVLPADDVAGDETHQQADQGTGADIRERAIRKKENDAHDEGNDYRHRY